MGLFLTSLFCSIGPYVCLYPTSTLPHWWPLKIDYQYKLSTSKNVIKIICGLYYVCEEMQLLFVSLFVSCKFTEFTYVFWQIFWIEYLSFLHMIPYDQMQRGNFTSFFPALCLISFSGLLLAVVRTSTAVLCWLEMVEWKSLLFSWFLRRHFWFSRMIMTSPSSLTFILR